MDRGDLRRRQTGDPHADAPAAGLRLRHPRPPELGVDGERVRDEPVGGAPVPSGPVRGDDPPVVERNVGELRPAVHVAQGPDTGRRCFKPVVQLDEGPAVRLDPGGLEVQLLRVRLPPEGGQQVRTLHDPLARRRLEPDPDRLTGQAFHPENRRPEEHVDPVLPGAMKHLVPDACGPPPWSRLLRVLLVEDVLHVHRLGSYLSGPSGDT
jgi:hypothetical protein